MSLVYQEFRHRGHLPLGALQPREHRGPVKVSHIVEKLVYVRQKENGIRDLVNRVLPINASDTISQRSEVYNNRDMEIKILVYGEIVFPFPNEFNLIIEEKR